MADFVSWFPSNPTFSSKSLLPTTLPRARLICFHGAGSDFTMFTSKGSVKNPLPNPLIKYCEDNDIQLITPHLPGRTTRLKEEMVDSASSVAEAVLDLIEQLTAASCTTGIYSLPDSVPLIVAGHSMGAICAYEFCLLMRHRNLEPLPKRLLLSCMIPPDTKPAERPWRVASGLSSEELKSECRKWGINEAVFEEGMWRMYEPILRGDFRIIDDYNFNECPKSVKGIKNAAEYRAPLPIPATLFFAIDDRRIVKQSSVEGWTRCLRGLKTDENCDGENKDNNMIEIVDINGGHNFLYESLGRLEWMSSVIRVVDTFLIELEYGQ